MATLEKIRSKAGLLIGIIGFSLFAFIVGDFLQSGSSWTNNEQRVVADIEGDKIMIEDYQKKINELTEVYKMNMGVTSLDEQTSNSVNDQAWESIIRANVLGEEYDAIGLAISSDELFDLVQGRNIDPTIRQMFANPQTGEFDKNIVVNYLKSLDQDQSGARKMHWLFYETLIKENRLNAKYAALLSKAIGMTSKEAQMIIDGSVNQKSIEFVMKPYSSIADNLVKISDSEIKEYYHNNIKNYKQEENRTISYITYDVRPTSDDFVSVETWIRKQAADLMSVNEYEAIKGFVKLSSDVAWDEKYIAPEQVENQLKVFVATAEVNAVYGPYQEGSSYKIAKLVNKAMIPDSVKASHILIKEATMERSVQVADSLLEVVKKAPALMGILASRYSKDGGSAEKGGDLGWFKEGTMVKPFNDAAFKGKAGEIVKVQSQFGIHIIKIEEQAKPTEKVQIAMVVRNVTPSTETSRKIYGDASMFIGKNPNADKFKSSAEAQKLQLKNATVRKNDRSVNELTNQARQIVRWAFEAEEGDLSKIFELDNQYVIAVVTKISADKYTTLSDASAAIRSALMKDKKAEMIIKEISTSVKSAGSISSLASTLGLQAQQADAISFNSYYVNGAGVEPGLVGAVCTAKSNVISNPIKGSNGVFVFNVTNSQPNTNSVNASNLKREFASMLQYRVGYQSFEALKANKDIIDNRIRFY